MKLVTGSKSRMFGWIVGGIATLVIAAQVIHALPHSSERGDAKHVQTLGATAPSGTEPDLW